MTDRHEALAIEGVRFFGEISASVSHEIKNVLAIINENAGLLQDMLGMHAKGSELSPERLSRLAQSIVRQVDRGDGIIKGLNRFAHSADAPNEPVDVGELITFVIRLAGRLIDLKGCSVKNELPDQNLTVNTNRFFLENLVWNCLCRAMDACSVDNELMIRLEAVGDQVQIRFCGLDPTGMGPVTGFPGPRELSPAELLKAKPTLDKQKGELSILLAK